MLSLQTLLTTTLLLHHPLLSLPTPIQATPPPKNYILPSTTHPGPATIQTTVTSTHAFAGPHLLYNNGTAYEGFYFDTVSNTSDAALILQFYPAFLGSHSAILLNARLPDDDDNNNGTFIQETIPAGALTLATTGDGSAARAQNGLMEWFAADDLSAVVVELNDPSTGVHASIVMRARAPLHVACGGKSEGASYMLTPLLGWAPVVADAEARVEVVVGGRRWEFEGAGYADQIFSLQPIFADLTQWYWGHARVGNYSLVWYYHIDAKKRVDRSFQLSLDGQVVVAACGDDSGRVTPRGGGGGDGAPVADPAKITGWEVSVEDKEGREYRFEVKNEHVAQDRDLLGAAHDIRWIGRVEGGLVGGERFVGEGLMEVVWATGLPPGEGPAGT